jgi:hypothetical protein
LPYPLQNLTCFQIGTLLPASEEAFDRGIEEKTCSLSEALRSSDAGYSSLAARVLASHLFHATLDHTLTASQEDNADDVKNGSYWNRHRELDNSISTMHMFLPAQLRLPRNFRSRDAVFINLVLYLSTICLHRAAVAKVVQDNLPAQLLTRSKTRLLPAAEEILAIIRVLPDIDTIFKQPFVPFAVYMAGTVFIHDWYEHHSRESEDTMEFLLNVMIAVAKHNAIAKSLSIRLALEMKQGGVDIPAMEKVKLLAPTSAQLPFPLLASRDTKSEHVQFCPVLGYEERQMLKESENQTEAAAAAAAAFSGLGPTFDLAFHQQNVYPAANEPVMPMRTELRAGGVVGQPLETNFMRNEQYPM